MGKPLIQQRRGKGSSTFRAPTHRSIGAVSLRPLDYRELEGVVYGKIVDIVKDTFHTAPIMIVQYETGEKVLLPAPEGVYVSQIVASGALAPINPGNVTFLKNIPVGTKISMIEIRPGDGGKLVRVGGAAAILVQKTESKAIVQLPSGKLKELPLDARAMIGQLAGGGRTDLPFVKAGNKYYRMSALNRYWPRPAAVAMNAVDHPFGGKHRRNHGGNVPVPKKGYPIKYGYYGPRKTGRGSKGERVGTKKKEE